MTIEMRPVACPHPGCDHYGEPLRGKSETTKRRLWLCGSCRGPLPITTPRQRKRRKYEEDDL